MWTPNFVQRRTIEETERESIVSGDFLLTMSATLELEKDSMTKISFLGYPEHCSKLRRSRPTFGDATEGKLED